MIRRTRLLTGGIALTTAALFLCTQVISQEKAPQSPGEDEMAEMMAKWKEMNAKGPEHKKFAKMVGTWDTETRIWMAPGVEPTVDKGTAKFRLILDGRYVEQTFKSAMMGEPFEGLAIDGYDRVKQKYVSIWMDNTSTGIFLMEGTADETGKVFTYEGTMDDPMTGEKDKPYKSIAREINDDKVVFEMYETRPGVGEVKTMEITYMRRK
jgi:hypothetical protein